MAKLFQTQTLSLYGLPRLQALQVAAVTICLWLVKFGGDDPSMLDTALKLSGPDLSPENQRQIVASVEKFDTASLQLACEYFFAHSNEALCSSLMDMLWDIALADGYLTFSEQEFMLFMGDLFSFSDQKFSELYEKHAVAQLPPIPDLSNAEWWRKKTWQQAHGQRAKYDSPLKGRLQYLGLLGLDEDADEEAIRKAYLRLAKVHHPDRFSALGEEAVKEARESFSRIKNAYERLTGRA